MNVFLRVLGKLTGGLFTAVGLIVTVLGVCWTGLFASLWFRGDHLSRGDRTGWLACALGSLAGALLLLAGVILWRASETGPKRTGTFRLKLTGKRRRRSTRQGAWNTFVWLCVGAEILWIPSGDPPGLKLRALLIGVPAIYLGFHAMFLCHELGHLSVAGLLGFDLQTLQIGTGPMLFNRKIGEMQLEWRAWLGGALVRSADRREPGWRGRHWWLVAGGPAAHAAWCAALAVWLLWRNQGSWAPLSPSDEVGTVALYLLGLSLLHLAYALVPRQGRIGALRVHSDGNQLLRTLRFSPEVVRVNLLVTWMRRVDIFWEEGRREEAWSRLREILAQYPNEAVISVAEGHYLAEQGNFAAAAASYQGWLQKEGLVEAVRRQLTAQRFGALARAHDAEAARRCCRDVLDACPGEGRAAWLDAFATEVIKHEIRAFLPDADAWSAEALSLEPGSLTLKGTRSGVLMELGRRAEAEAMLRQVWAGSASEVDAAFCAFYLGVAAKSRGRRREMRRWFREANELVPFVGTWLKRRIAAEMSAATVAR